MLYIETVFGLWFVVYVFGFAFELIFVLLSGIACCLFLGCLLIVL